MRGLAGAACIAVLLVLAPAARGSALLADADVRDPTLAVDRAGIALVRYESSSGAPRHVLVWGALNALAPGAGERQVRFRFDYSGGYRASGDARYWARFRNACRPYDGPPLAFYVAGCTAPDGSYWALQAWSRSGPAVELHVSHWRGPLAVLDVQTHWTYGGRFVGIFGRATYEGVAVHGLGSDRLGNPVDRFGRNVYIETSDESSPSGWRRETAILLHAPNGTFCHSFVGRPPGRLLRVFAVGPGVTPDVEWQGAAPGPYDPTQAASERRAFDAFMAGDARCAAER
jgi:hypothetical protein